MINLSPQIIINIKFLSIANKLLKASNKSDNADVLQKNIFAISF